MCWCSMQDLFLLLSFLWLRAGDEFVTDANGRSLQLRTRGTRPTWDWNATEPIAGNFYPITTLVAISGRHDSASSDAATTAATDVSLQNLHSGNGTAGAGAGGGQARGKHAGADESSADDAMTLGLVTDRAQAAASLEGGSLHVLLHRRLLQVLLSLFIFDLRCYQGVYVASLAPCLTAPPWVLSKAGYACI